MKNFDYTRYDLNLNGHRVLNLPKNRAIREVVDFILRNGGAVSEISKLDFGLRPSQLLIGVDGEVNSEEFIRRAKLEQKAVDLWFDPVRYFCRDGELIKLKGRTYAVNSQWTGKLFRKQCQISSMITLTLILNFHPQVRVNLQDWGRKKI